MRHDDPRHGSYAGYVAHYKRGQPACEPCKIARARYAKQYRIRRTKMPTLGEAGANILRTIPLTELAARTGLSSSVLCRLRRQGATARVRPETKARVYAAARGEVPTRIGVQRRIQALAMLGWSADELSRRTGIWPDNILALRRGETRCYVHRDVAAKVAEVYTELCMTPAPPGRSSTRLRREAESKGWAGPLAWTNIDDPNERPAGYVPVKGRSHRDIDPVIVDRLLDGITVPSTRAEKDEALRRWKAMGKSEKSLTRIHNWKEGRYGKGDAA